MLGLSLIHIGFLAATAAVAVPILIHLLMRPQAREETIGSIRFLRLVLQRSTRRRNIRRWLLLALRTLAVLLLALLFARPYFSTAGGPGQERQVLVLVDRSASMQAVASGRTLFAAAQEAASKIIAQQPEGTEVRLAYFDDRGVTAAPDLRPESHPQPGFAGTDYGLALAWARDEFTVSPRPYRQLCLVTDLQRSGLKRTPCTGFPADVAVKIEELGKRPAMSLAVEQAEASQTTLRDGQPVVVAAQIANTGPFPARNVVVRLVLTAGPAKVEQTQQVSVAAGTNETVRFSVPIKAPGRYQGSIEVAAEDGFPLDDRRWLAFDVRRPDRLLLVDGEPGATAFGNETYYLEAALRLALPNAGPPQTPYEPIRVAYPAARSLGKFEECAAVILCNVEALSDVDSARLLRYVSAGGRLLVFAGGEVRPAGYAALERTGILPASLAGTAEAGLYRWQTWDQEHAIFRPLSDPQQGDLRRLAFRRIARLKPAADAKVLAATASDEPLLVERRQERGTVLMCAAAVDRDWGDWPQSRLYVPVVHQIVGYLTDRLPDSERLRHELAGSGPGDAPGISQAGESTVVRNLDARESRTERCSEQDFRTAFQLSAEAPPADAEPLAAAGPPDRQRPDEAWPYLVWALLTVLVAEVFVANRSHA